MEIVKKNKDNETINNRNQNEHYKIAEYLFVVFDAMYPAIFRKQFNSDLDVERWLAVWSEALAEEKINIHKAKEAIAKLRKTAKYVPTLPEFLQACETNVDYESWFYEAVKNMYLRTKSSANSNSKNEKENWRNKAHFWAAAEIGTDLLSHSYESLKTRWRSVLDSKLKIEDELEDIPPPRLAIAYDYKSACSKSVAEKHLAAIRELFKRRPAYMQDLQDLEEA